MPRGPRLDAPGIVHHVVVRGIERRRIFVDERDRAAFLDRVDRLIPELDFTCFAWVLMSNHVHLVLRTGAVPLSRLMASLGTSYAVYFNKRHERAGHLFQNRFWSRIVEDESDLLGVVLYVRRNPIRAGLVEDGVELERLDWCGHGSLVGARSPRPFEAVAATRALIASDARAAIRRFRERIQEQVVDILVTRPGELPAESKPDPAPPKATHASETPRPPLGELVEAACQANGCARAIIATKRRVAVDTRTRVAREAVLVWGYAVRDVASALGVASSSVSRALERATQDE